MITIKEIEELPEPSARLHRAGLWLQHTRAMALRHGGEWWARVEYARGVFDALCAVEWGECDA